MTSTFIDPSLLDADAVVPQAADNQFVNESLFQKIIKRKVDFSDEEVCKEKRRTVHSEFVRSLVYGSQTVINRAYLHNNYGIYHNFEETKDNHDNAVAFSELLRNGSIVPFLYMENELSLEQIEAEQDFTKDIKGVAALRHLIDITGDFNVTGFSKGHRNLENIGKKFRDYICSLKNLDENPNLARIMCDELFPSAKSEDITQAFLKSVQKFGQWADAYRDKHKKLTREIIYDNQFVEPNSNVAQGAFRERGNTQLQFAIKKLVDLKYNTNMPDAIGRYTFTPYSMPTRSALADDFEIGKFASSDVEELIANKLSGEFAKRFHAAASKAMYLPFLGELTMKDVSEIRQFESRKPFIEKQKLILENPLAVTDNLVAYQDAFEAFQRELSRWYVKKYKRDPVERLFENFATVGITFGGKVLIYGITGGSDGLFEVAASEAVLEIAKEKIKGVAVKLMLKVYDHINKRFDDNLSFSIEVLRTGTSYTSDDIRNLVENIGKESLLIKQLTIPAEADTN